MTEGMKTLMFFNFIIVFFVSWLVYFVDKSAKKEIKQRNDFKNKAKDIFESNPVEIFHIFNSIFDNISQDKIIKYLAKKESSIILPNYPFVNKLLSLNNIEPTEENRIIYGFVVYYYLQEKYINKIINIK